MTETPSHAAGDPVALKALLQWYLEAGVDEAIADAPQDRFAEQVQALAAREAAFEQDPTGGKLWGSPDAIENLITSACGLLTAPQG